MPLDIINNRLNKALLCSEDDVKTECPIDANKAQGTIVPFIQAAEKTRVKKVLGATLYERLHAEWAANGQDAAILPDGTTTGTAPQVAGDTTNYKELYPYVLDALVWWAYTLSIRTTSITVSEQGALKRNTEYADAADIGEVKRVEAQGEALARTYTQELIDYLELSGCKCTSGDDKTSGEGIKESGTGTPVVWVAPKPWHCKKEY
jgi:hypothetical protein